MFNSVLKMLNSIYVSRWYLMLLTIVCVLSFLTTLYSAFVKAALVDTFVSFLYCLLAAFGIRYVRRGRNRLRMMQGRILALKPLRNIVTGLSYSDDSYELSTEGYNVAVVRLRLKGGFLAGYAVMVAEDSFDHLYDSDAGIDRFTSVMTIYFIRNDSDLVEKQMHGNSYVTTRSLELNDLKPEHDQDEPFSRFVKGLIAQSKMPDDLRYASVDEIIKLQAILTQ